MLTGDTGDYLRRELVVVSSISNVLWYRFHLATLTQYRPEPAIHYGTAADMMQSEIAAPSGDL